MGLTSTLKTKVRWCQTLHREYAGLDAPAAERSPQNDLVRYVVCLVLFNGKWDGEERGVLSVFGTRCMYSVYVCAFSVCGCDCCRFLQDRREWMTSDRDNLAKFHGRRYAMSGLLCNAHDWVERGRTAREVGGRLDALGAETTLLQMESWWSVAAVRLKVAFFFSLVVLINVTIVSPLRGRASISRD